MEKKLSLKNVKSRCLRRDYSGFALRINSKLKHKISKFDVKVISLISMTANDDRIKEIVKHAEGFIYTVTMNATTGKNGTFHPQLKDKLKHLKAHTDIPVVAGFGIRTKEHIKDLATVADGVVIGSEIVKRFCQDNNEIRFTI